MNYDKLIQKTKSKKFDELYKNNEFLQLPKSIRDWWIRYWKITQSWDTYMKNYEDMEWWEQCVNNWIHSDLALYILSRDLHAEKYGIWSPRNNMNHHLKAAIDVLKEYHIDWEHYQYENKMIFCNLDPVNGHSGCKFYSKCSLRKR